MDSRKLAHLESFAAFIEFLSNPDEYRTLVKETNKALKEWKETNEKARGIKDVDEWKARVQSEMNERSAALDALAAEFDKTMAAEKAGLAKSLDTHAKAKAKLAEDARLLEAKQAAVDAMLKEKEELAKKAVQLNEKEDRLNALDKELKEKMAKLKQLMAGDA